MVLHFAHALRSLRRAPGYVAAFVVTLGLAIGVNSAVFSMVNGVILKPLPFPDADRIVRLKQPVAAAGVENAGFSFMELDDLRAGSTLFDEFVEFGDWDYTVSGEGEPHRAVGGLVTSNFFGVLGMRPALGRLLTDEDDAAGAEPVVVLTDEYWERVFGRDRGVVGSIVRLSNGVPTNMMGLATPIPTRVVGVLEPGLHYTGSRRADFYVNYATNDHYQGAAMRDARDHRMTTVFGRIRRGVALEAARSELRTIMSGIHRESPESYPADLGYGIEATPWHQELTRNARGVFLFLMATVAVILGLAAANVANLTLTRLIRKQTELSTRAALGATTTTLRLHLTAEHILLGLAGGALGILFAHASRSALVAYASRFTVRAQEVGIDWTVLGVTLGVAVGVAALLAWLPGLPVAPGTERVAAGSRATDTRRRRWVQRGLVVSQLALSFTLLVGATLLVRSLVALSSQDPGFETERVLTLWSPSGPGGFAFPADEAFFRQVMEEVGAYPGVRSVATASWVPLGGDVTPTPRSARTDSGDERGLRFDLVATNNISPGYFETLGIPVVTGRSIDWSDRPGSANVIVLNRSAARAHFGADDPIGRRISFSDDGRGWSPWYEVVGVVEDSREIGMEQEGVHTYYGAAAQARRWGPAMLVSTMGDLGPLSQQIREVIHRLQSERAVERFEALSSLRDRNVAPSRLNAVLFGSFAVLALMIAAVGVLGALAFSVSQRVREFGVRMALGATQRMVLRNVLFEGAALLGIALIAGAGAAVVLGRSAAGLLYGVRPVDPLSIVVAAGVLGAVALGAALVPARRATRIQPSAALKSD